MPRRQSSQTAPVPAAPLIDLAALGDRLRRWRQWRGVSQAALARQAGVDPMVVSRLEGQQKPRLEVETAAKLARVCRWTLDQLCGLAPVPPIPAPAPPYSPLDAGRPDWLPARLQNSTEERQLAAQILAWQIRGATPDRIADSLTAWGSVSMGGKPWTRDTVQHTVRGGSYGTKHRQRALLLAYGFTTEAHQHAAWWRRQR